MNFIRKRIITTIVAFFVATNLDFILPRLVPGNAAEIFASGTKLPATAVILIQERFGLNQPVTVQYVDYLRNVFGTWPPFFGFSFEFYPENVSYLIGVRIGWTILLIAASFILALLISYGMAMIATRRRGGKFEFGSVYTSIALTSTPPFWVAMILIWTFAVTLGWFPLFGNIDFNPGTGASYYISILRHAVLPVLTLTIVIFGQNFLILRGASQEVLKSDYVAAAKARGLKEGRVAREYIVRNSLLPLISLLGYSISSLISAVVLIEVVFGYTGLGDLIVDAIINRDYPVLEGSFFYLTLVVVIGALIGDFLLLKLDPRLRK
ncbi:MAG: ABC transporter permease [Nitrososphaerales archaeon]